MVLSSVFFAFILPLLFFFLLYVFYNFHFHISNTSLSSLYFSDILHSLLPLRRLLLLPPRFLLLCVLFLLIIPFPHPGTILSGVLDRPRFDGASSPPLRRCSPSPFLDDSSAQNSSFHRNHSRLKFESRAQKASAGRMEFTSNVTSPNTRH